MELFVALYLLLILISLQALLSLMKRRNKKLPPGPFPLPVIGNLLKLGKSPHSSMTELAKTYGPIMLLKIFQLNVIVISSPDVAKEVLRKQDLAFSSRATLCSTLVEKHRYYSVAWLPISDRWRRLRKIISTNIFSTQKLDANQNLRRQKVAELITYVKKCSDENILVDIGQATFTSSLNLISNIFFSMDLADPNQKFATEFKQHFWSMMEESGKPNLADFYPILARLDPQGLMKSIGIPFRKVMNVIVKLIDQRIQQRKLRKTCGPETDVMDALLDICEQNDQEIDRTQIEHLCMDLFVGGADTNSSSVEWVLAELLQNPEILLKAKVELEETIGKGKQVEESDLPMLPYLQAIVKETIRKHPPLPLLMPREVANDVELCGYIIPRGARVLVNFWAIARDPRIWPDPTLFKPERFLGSDIDFKGFNFEFTPFGAGRRICPGMPLAIRMIPVMAGSLINCFDWMIEGGIEPKDINMEEKVGATVQKAKPMRAYAFSV